MITRATFRLSDGIFWNIFHPEPTEASIPKQAIMATEFSLARTPRYKATVMVPILLERLVQGNAWSTKMDAGYQTARSSQLEKEFVWL